MRPCKVLLEKFANNETNVQLLDQVRCQDVYIIQTGKTPSPLHIPASNILITTGAVKSNDAVMELLLIINSCRLASAEPITVITPYFPYSKAGKHTVAPWYLDL